MNEKQKTSKGKFLSLILRHQPETIGLTLDEVGWALLTPACAFIQRYGSSS